MGKKSWIWTGSRGYSPDGYLQIGQVLSDPRDPASSLMPNGPLSLPKGTKFDGNTETDVRLNATSEVASSFNAWAEATGAPVQTAVGTSAEESTRDIWFIDEVEEKHVILGMPYVKEVLKNQDVKEHYRSRFWVLGIFKRLYMVTGVRIARGAELLTVTVDSSGLNGMVKIDGQQIEVPLNAGMRMTFRKKNVQSTSASARNFVWAYRLAEINFTPTRQEPFSGGDTQAAEDEEAAADQSDSGLDDLIPDEESPLEGEEFGGETGDEWRRSLDHGIYFLEKTDEEKGAARWPAGN